MSDEIDNVVALMPWDRAVRRSKQRRKVAELLDAPDAGELVRSFPELDAYYAVKEIGPSDAVSILALLATNQIQAILDLEVWRRHELDRSDAILWLELFREAGIDALDRAARALDPEALAVLFSRRLHLAQGPKDDSEDEPLPEWVNEPDVEIVSTPDRRFLIAARPSDEDPVEEEEQKAIVRLVEDLYRSEDWEWVASVLRLAMSDSTFALEEEALRFRNGRLEDLGFAPLERAIEVYSRADPALLSAPAERAPMTDLALSAIHAGELDGGLFQRAMRRIESNDAVAHIEGDLLPLANEVLVADGVSPGAIEEIRLSLTHLRGYVEVGLSFDSKSPAEPEHEASLAAERLLAHPIRSIFQVGYGLALGLKTRARAILGDRRFVELLPDDERAVLGRLDMKRPRASARDPTSSDDALPFDPERYRMTKALLDDLEGLHVAFEALAFDLSPDPGLEPPMNERTFDIWLVTAAAQALLGEAFEPIPLDRHALLGLVDRLGALEGRRFGLPPIPLEGPARDVVSRRLRKGLDRLSEALWPLVGSSEIDPRFVDGVVRRIRS